MHPHVHLCLVLHNHQPIGNFDGVFEQAYQDSYLPFLDVFEPYDSLQISLHTSGPLMMWLAERHPEYLDRRAALVETERMEIIGGPQYEPILTMLPRRDRIGQIRAYTAVAARTARCDDRRDVDARAGLGIQSDRRHRRRGHCVHGPGRLSISGPPA